MATNETNAASSEGEEIDRIMKEIEDLEKKMDTSPAAPAEALMAQETVEPASPSKVVAFRPAATVADTESLAEADAPPSIREPLVRGSSKSTDGLALKIGGCSEVSLEFTREGVTVSLSCTDGGLCISTDQGAEFRIPFKRGA